LSALFVADYEIQSGYSVRLETDDGDGGVYEKVFLITIQDGADCGNSVIESGEECDDSNVGTGDGCSNVCVIEA
jgi:cysteine-rich repeat protein